MFFANTPEPFSGKDMRSALLHISLHSHFAMYMAYQLLAFEGGSLRRKFVLLHACCRVHAKLEDAIGKVSCVHGTLQMLHFWLWHRGRPTCILFAAFPVW